MSFLNPMALVGLISIPVIVAFYLLKQKYTDMVIPSLFLWEKVFEAQQALTPWQKLKRRLLMFLQILIALVIVLLLAQPQIVSTQYVGNTIFVLDASMSMQATDVPQSRFEEAKKRIEEAVGGMDKQTAVVLVVMSKTPYIAVNQTEDKALFIERLKKINVTNGGVDEEKTKSLIDILSSAGNFTVQMYTDQNYDVGRDKTTVIFGHKADNAAITNLSDYIDADRIVAMAKVKNFSDKTVEKTVNLFADNKICDSKAVSLAPFSEGDVFFTNVNLESTELMAALSEEDVLPADDARYAVVTKSADKKVLLVTEQNIFLEKAIRALPNVALYVGDKDNIENLKGYNLYVFDGVLPETLPKDGQILLFNPPVGNALLQTAEAVSVGALHYKDSDLLRLIPTFHFLIDKSKKLQMPAWATDVISSDETPIVISGEIENQKIVVVGFDLHDSDLPLKKEFPIFMYNVFQWLMPEGVVKAQTVTAMDTVRLSVSPESSAVQVVSPDGTITNVAPPFPVLPYTDTNATGFFIVEETRSSGVYTQSFAVNPDTADSNLFLDAEGSTTSVVPQQNEKNINLQRPLLCFLLLLILFEWWVYMRER